MDYEPPPEITLEEIGEDHLDLGPYELLRMESQGYYIVLIVRDKRNREPATR